MICIKFSDTSIIQQHVSEVSFLEYILDISVSYLNQIEQQCLVILISFIRKTQFEIAYTIDFPCFYHETLVLFSFISQTEYFTSLNTKYIIQVVNVTALNILLSVSRDTVVSQYY